MFHAVKQMVSTAINSLQDWACPIISKPLRLLCLPKLYRLMSYSIISDQLSRTIPALCLLYFTVASSGPTGTSRTATGQRSRSHCPTTVVRNPLTRLFLLQPGLVLPSIFQHFCHIAHFLTLLDVCRYAFGCLCVNIHWVGEGIDKFLEFARKYFLSVLSAD